MQNVIHFGAGNIGRGFIGNLLSRSGYRVIFTDVSNTIIPALQQQGRYTVEEVGVRKREIVVEPVTGLYTDAPELMDALVETPIITTAVGPGILPVIARTIAEGLVRRRLAGNDQPINIIACENMISGSTALRGAVLSHCDPQTTRYINNSVGFPDSAVDRIVPPMPESGDPLRVRVEEFSEWIVDRTGFVGPIPEIEGMQLTDNLPAFLERKLFTLNTGHAVTAYLGTLSGYETISESIADPRILSDVRRTMVESGEVLIRRYGFDRDVHHQYIEKILRRFQNPYLTDKVTRVGRQPIRKLGRQERIVKPLLGTLEYDLPREGLVTAAATALAFRSDDDPQAVEIGEIITSAGVRGAIAAITGLGTTASEERLIDEIATAWDAITTRSIVEEYVRRRTRIVTVQEAERLFAELLAEAAAGNEVIVARSGRPMVRMTSIGLGENAAV
jgi:mannitol-1-phosphate 5-dehydrogenase